MIKLVKPSRGHITQFYANTQPDGNPHAGQDYAYTNGREIFPEVYAAADGVVLFAGDSRGLAWPNIMYLNPDFDRTDGVDSSAGNYTIIAHYVNGVQVALTGYGHQEEVWVKAGDTVRAGQRIGTVGETGFSAGKHLHFDLVISPFRVNVAPFYGRVDPNPYFTGSLTYASESITPLEDDMNPEEKKLLFAVLDKLNARTASLPGQPDVDPYWVTLADRTSNITGAQYNADLIGAVDKINGGVAGLLSRPVAEIAAEINAAGIAREIQAELATLIGGK